MKLPLVKIGGILLNRYKIVPPLSREKEEED